MCLVKKVCAEYGFEGGMLQLTTELSAKERKKTCRTSAMGCAVCKEPICKECWKEGYDKHA